MAGKKSVYENAHAESIWATIKRQMLEKGGVIACKMLKQSCLTTLKPIIIVSEGTHLWATKVQKNLKKSLIKINF